MCGNVTKQHLSGEEVPQHKELSGTHARESAREVGNSGDEDHVRETGRQAAQRDVIHEEMRTSPTSPWFVYTTFIVSISFIWSL